MNETLHLVLNFYWFSKVEDGTKGGVEYRVMDSLKWQRDIWQKRFQYTRVCFRRGMTKQTLTFEIQKIDRGPCSYKGWPNEYFRIHYLDDRCPYECPSCGERLKDIGGVWGCLCEFDGKWPSVAQLEKALQ